MFLYSDNGMISRGGYPSWLQGKKKKMRWKRSFQESEKIHKGDKYRKCPTCRGVGGNRACTICHGGGMAKIQRQKTNNGTSMYGVPRSQAVNRSFAQSGDLVYDQLPPAAYSDGECCRCEHYPNRESMMRMSNGTEKVVVKCSQCGTVMRPYGRRW